MTKTKKVIPEQVWRANKGYTKAKTRASKRAIIHSMMSSENVDYISFDKIPKSDKECWVKDFTKRSHVKKEITTNWRQCNNIVPSNFKWLADIMRSFDKSFSFDYDDGCFFGAGSNLIFAVTDYTCNSGMRICLDLREWWDKPKYAQVILPLPANDIQESELRYHIRNVLSGVRLEAPVTNYNTTISTIGYQESGSVHGFVKPGRPAACKRDLKVSSSICASKIISRQNII